MINNLSSNYLHTKKAKKKVAFYISMTRNIFCYLSSCNILYPFTFLSIISQDCCTSICCSWCKSNLDTPLWFPRWPWLFQYTSPPSLLFCHGIHSLSKYKVLYTVLIWIAQFMIKTEYLGVDISDINIFIKAQLHPNTIATNFWMLFYVFTKESLQYLSKHFNQTSKSLFTFPFFVFTFAGQHFNIFISLTIFSVSSLISNYFYFCFIGGLLA